MKKLFFVFAVVAMIQSGVALAEDTAGPSSRVGEATSCCGNCVSDRSGANSGTGTAATAPAEGGGDSASGAR